MWPKCRKLISPKKVTQFVACLIIVLLLYLFVTRDNRHITIKTDLVPRQNGVLCNRIDERNFDNIASVHFYPSSSSTPKSRQQILLFIQDASSHDTKMVTALLDAARIKYHPQYGTVKNLPALIDNERGRYATIVFEDAEIYLKMNKWNRQILDRYCIEYDVGVVFFFSKKKPSKGLDNQPFADFPLSYSTNIAMKDGLINPHSQLLRITRAGKEVAGDIGNAWSVFNFNHSTYEVVLSGSLVDPSITKRRKLFSKSRKDVGSTVRSSLVEQLSNQVKSSAKSIENAKYPIVILDNGKYDRIRKVIYGNSMQFWLNKVLFLDALSFLSRGRLALPLNRYIQIDIDDIFVSVEGTRMKKEDVQKLIEFQENMRKRIPGFNFLLGFSGKFFGKGNEEESEGDKMFLESSHHFTWFPHMWSHMQAHLFGNLSYLCQYMQPNKEFAIRHKLNVTSHYAVAPHHAGIFPVHEPLYECWKKVWDIDITSTEEYPNLRPDTKRRGFIYRGIKVLPRQTCGLFTHTNYLEKYPGGPEKLDSSINGGQLFLTMLLNKYNIFMTHFSNYGNDRLALYVFDKAINFIQCWTNLYLTQISPADMAYMYFKDHPEEETPIWSNPCADPRHLETWARDKSCDKLPNFVIVGPQKTGTTALHWFLEMHPNLKSSNPSPSTFEEIQFFNTPNYMKGLDWYMDFFSSPNEEGNERLFYEKSANYFSSNVTPHRMRALLPHSHIIILLIDPAKRAYSWYQHMKSHNDPIALNFSFQDVIDAGSKSSPALLALQARCLLPGRYSEHIEKWLEYFPSSQVILEDGDMLVKNPTFVLKRLQLSLGIKNIFNYSNHIKFDAKKGFFCKIGNTGHSKCLGKGKGREYPEMSEKSRMSLKQYYKESNKKLVKIFENLRRPLPSWLLEATQT